MISLQEIMLCYLGADVSYKESKFQELINNSFLVLVELFILYKEENSPCCGVSADTIIANTV